ncbi:MAG: hypothetical protein ACRCYX_05025 [Dermatophilaceae bacterium]
MNVQPLDRRRLVLQVLAKSARQSVDPVQLVGLRRVGRWPRMVPILDHGRSFVASSGSSYSNAARGEVLALGVCARVFGAVTGRCARVFGAVAGRRGSMFGAVAGRRGPMFGAVAGRRGPMIGASARHPCARGQIGA